MCNVTGIFALIGRVPAASVAVFAMAIPAWTALSAVLAVAAIGVTFSPQASIAATPQVTGVRVGVYPGKTRIVLDVDRSVKFTSFVLPQPFRVVVDMSEVTWSPSLRNPPKGGLVTGMRFGLFKPGSSRVVLDSTGPVRIAKAFVIPPSGKNRSYRLVIDIAKTSRDAFMMSYKRPTRKPVATAAPRPSPVPVPLKRKPARPDEKKMIMIDPGHGGVDPGAMSRSGVWEKHIVLAFARELRQSLLATGKFRVRLTRDRDVFIRLRDRIA
ncbi:unnamed protein product, partial [Discosporangium mesarthrocarpum]